MLELDEADADDDEGDDPEGDFPPRRDRMWGEDKPTDNHARAAEIDGNGPVEPEPLPATPVRDEQGDSNTEQHATEYVWKEGGGHGRHSERFDQPLGIEEQQHTQEEVDQGIGKEERSLHPV
jgi:hypothetical protein